MAIAPSCLRAVRGQMSGVSAFRSDGGAGG